MGIQPQESLEDMEPDQKHLMEAFANQTALALERTLLAEKNLDTQRRMDREQVRSALLSSVSHDLRTPLAAITEAAGSLIEGEGRLDAEARLKLAAAIREEGHQQAGAEPARETTTAAALVEGALARLRSTLGEREVRLELPANLPPVQVDPVLIEQVLVNLLENANRYSPLPAPIEVKGWATARSLTLSVADHGPGIPEGQEERIFEKLVRIQPPGTRMGAGLGLSICKAIVEAHGGKIQASNRTQGGAAFRISLPLEAEANTAPAEE